MLVVSAKESVRDAIESAIQSNSNLGLLEAAAAANANKNANPDKEQEEEDDGGGEGEQIEHQMLSNEVLMQFLEGKIELDEHYVEKF